MTFDSDGGAEVPSQTLMNNRKAERPEDPEKEGRVFDAWVKEDGGVYDFDTPVTGDLTLKASWLTPWGALQREINKGGEITLTEDVTAEETDTSLVIPEGLTVTLDLNGHTLDYNTTENSERQSPAIIVNGTLILNDSSADGSGRITGVNNNTEMGACGTVCVEGSFTMNGGTIKDNLSQIGGGVCNEGTFTMTNGKITGNTATLGGSVYKDGTFTMTGGGISGNTAGDGQGNAVYTKSSLKGCQSAKDVV